MIPSFRIRSWLFVLLCPLLVTACQAQEVSSSGVVDFKPVFTNLSLERPIFLTAPNNNGNRLYVLEQRGRIISFPNKQNLQKSDVIEVLDIQDRVEDHNEGHNEQGLLGMAFHPNVAENHKVYLDYNPSSGQRRNVVSEWTIDPETGKIDPDSERVLMEFPQPYGNHNGGHLEFGPDGYLYITRGDGGAGGDPKNNGQDPTTLLGAIIRIGVNNRENGKPYAVPDDNPFVNDPNKRSEIYAYGLRNVWRFSWDDETGRLWAGDVGQNAYEEVDLIRKGGNYGWNIMEGFHKYADDKQKTGSLIDPVHEYPHSVGGSITGGYVYRGDRIDALQGKYLFADYNTGPVWALQYDGESGESQVAKIGNVPAVASFGEDRQGEVYLCSYDGDRIYKIVPGK
jgi:glucose/arabinose dehydrogenase